MGISEDFKKKFHDDTFKYIDEHAVHAIDYEDLTALALIGDMMNMKDFETHYLTKDGLQRIRNPFFQEMVTR